MNSRNYSLSVEKFRNIVDNAEMKQEVREIIENRDIVISRYQPIFKYENISNLSEEDFRSFLYFENNRHWSGLFRHVTSLCSDMELLRETLAILIDPARPLASRFDEAVSRIKGLGKALATAILLVSSPDKYGVWNNTSEAALKETGLWRDFVRGRTPGKQYEQINKLLIQLNTDLGIDLWTLDALMWGILPEEESVPEDELNDNNKPVFEILRTTYSFVDDIQHEVLKSRLLKLSLAPLDTVIREAGVVFENYLRNKVDPNTTKHGVDLVDDALKPGGKLIFSSHPGEQQGVLFLYRGAMQFIRNPPMHKIIDYPESMAEQFLRLIDSLMLLLDQGTIADDVTTFLSMCDEAGRSIFEPLLFMAKSEKLPIHWGVRGFSINADLEGNHVVLCYGYPPPLKAGQSPQGLWTGFVEIDKKVEGSSEIIKKYLRGFNDLGLFIRSGKMDLKYIITDKPKIEKIQKIVDLVNALSHDLQKMDDLKKVEL